MSVKNVKIKPVPGAEQIPFELLMLADPSRVNLDKYISKSDIYTAYQDSELVGCYALLELDDKTIEIKNIAVGEKYQGKGIATFMLNDAFEKARSKGAEKVIIGTGNSSIGQLYLYQKVGFRITKVLVDYFIKNYDKPIFEKGIPCRDMIVLTKTL